MCRHKFKGSQFRRCMIDPKLCGMGISEYMCVFVYIATDIDDSIHSSHHLNISPGLSCVVLYAIQRCTEFEDRDCHPICQISMI